MAIRNECKYTETSVVLNNGVDELLAGTLTQIRLRNKAAAEAMKQNNFLSLSQTECVEVCKDCSLVGGFVDLLRWVMGTVALCCTQQSRALNIDLDLDP